MEKEIGSKPANKNLWNRISKAAEKECEGYPPTYVKLWINKEYIRKKGTWIK
jgi:hypothetical protein